MTLNLFQAIEIERTEVLSECLTHLTTSDKLILLNYALFHYANKHRDHDPAELHEHGNDQSYIGFIYRSLRKYKRLFAAESKGNSDSTSNIVDNKKKPNIRWNKSSREFMEVMYALLLANAIECSSKELFIMEMSMFLNHDLNNPWQTLNQLKSRNFDRLTPLIDKMREEMRSYLEQP